MTLRSIILLLSAAPVIALGIWLPLLEPFGWLYALTAVGLCSLDWLLARRHGKFEILRQHEKRLSLGAENPIRLEVRSLLPYPTPLWVRDELPPEFEVDKQIHQTQIPARGVWQGRYYVRPLRRGDYQFGDLALRWSGPLGLSLCRQSIPASAPVKVYPNLLDIRRYDLMLHRNRLQEIGLRHSRLSGQGTEFERLREYQPDDDFRRINWKATARRHRPATTEFQVERSQNIIAVLDTGRMMQSPVANIAKLDYLINAVLFLGYVASGRGDRVGLLTFADQVTSYLNPEQGRSQFYRMLEVLYRVEAQPVEPDYGRALSYLALKHRRRALVVIFTDLTGGLSLQRLVQQVGQLARTSLPLVVTISDSDVLAAAHQQPHDSLSAYQRTAAGQMMDERALTLEGLRRQGVLTLDVPANQLSVAVINRYLELKDRIRL